MAKFQVQLAGEWKDYSHQEDKILKRAYMAGFPTAKFHLRGQSYVYNFQKMVQLNLDSGKERKIRQPLKWKPPAKPLVPPGPTTVINVPAGSPGTTINVPHPRVKGAFISVKVPASAKPGQAMLVPVPPVATTSTSTYKPTADRSGRREHHSGIAKPGAAVPAAVATPPVSETTASTKSGGSGWTTGGTVAAGTAAILGVGGAAVGGAILGDHIAEHGMDATVDAAGEGLEDFFVDAGEFVVDAAEDVGDFVMDLF